VFEITDNAIEITQGDTGRFTIEITNKDGTAYQPVEGDVLKFTVKKNSFDTTPTIQKVLDSFVEGEDIQFVIEPADTVNLPLGLYTYDIEITLANGDVNTIILPNNFYILEGVT
jgi:hypothetical protein